MHYTDLQDCNPARFKRLTGVRKETFHEMLAALQQNLRDFGRPPALCRADQLLLTLMYYREYRTQLHIAQTYKVSESAVCRTIHKVEKALLASDTFHLPGDLYPVFWSTERVGLYACSVRSPAAPGC